MNHPGNSTLMIGMSGGEYVPFALGDDGTLPSAEGGATETKQDAILTALAGLLTELNDKLDADDTLLVKSPVQALTFVTGAAASSGDNTLIAAPSAGQTIRVRSISWQNETAVATTSIIKFGATAKWRLRAKDDGNGVVLQFRPGEEWVVGDAVALVLNLSGANSHGYSVAYYTGAV